MPYKFIDNVSIADVAFEATGKTMEEMLASAGSALMNTQVKDLRSIGTTQERRFELEEKDPERLLHKFLQELIYYKDADLMLFREYDLRVSKSDTGLKLKASLKGEPIDQKKHELLVDVKAVSWHMFEVKQSQEGWKAFVILDV